jgi:hypothetical protein
LDSPSNVFVLTRLRFCLPSIFHTPPDLCNATTPLPKIDFNRIASMEYKSKMDFLLAKAKTTKRSHPPQRKGEIVNAMDLFYSVYEHQSNISKTEPQTSRNVQLELAETNTFEEYCNSINLGSNPRGPQSKANSQFSGGTEDIDLFKNFVDDMKLREGQKNEHNLPPVPIPSTLDPLSLSTNGPTQLSRVHLPASAEAQNISRSKTFFDGDPRQNISDDRQRYMGTSQHHGKMPQSGAYLPVSLHGQHKSSAVYMSWEKACLRHSYVPPPGANMSGKVFPQILSLVKFFSEQVYVPPTGAYVSAYVPAYVAVNAQRRPEYPAEVNLRNTRENAFVFRHQDATRRPASVTRPESSNDHNFMSRPHGTKIMSVLTKIDGQPVLLMWIELKNNCAYPNIQATAAEYNDLLSGLEMYHKLDTADRLPSLKEFYKRRDNYTLFLPRADSGVSTSLAHSVQQGGSRTFERLSPSRTPTRSKQKSKPASDI